MDIVGDSTTDTVDFKVKSTYVIGLLTGAISSVLTSDLTASRVLVSDGSGKISASAVTATVLSYLDATSSVQTQLDSKVASTRAVNSGAGLSGGGDLSADRTLAVDINGQTEDTTPDLAADFVMTYDTSASGLKKVKLQNLSSGGGLADAHQFGVVFGGDFHECAGSLLALDRGACPCVGDGDALRECADGTDRGECGGDEVFRKFHENSLGLMVVFVCGCGLHIQ